MSRRGVPAGIAAGFLFLMTWCPEVLAQTPRDEGPPAPPGWTGSFGAGLALTQGNNDFDDGLYILGLGLSASITARTQIEIEALKTCKNRTPDPDVQSNDVALLLSFVCKF